MIPSWKIGAIAIALSLISSAACSSDPTDSGQHQDKLTPCDALTSQYVPIQLGTILGAGKDQNGTVFMVDQVADYRLFVSNGDKLVRQRIAGSGIEGNTSFTFSVFDYDPQFTLKIETAPTLRMGIVYGPLSTKTFTIGEQGEELTIVGSDAVAAYALQNLPGDVHVEYAATLPDQRWLVVTRPLDDWTYQDFRLFLGPSDAIAERHVKNVARAKDGGSTTIRFDLDGADAIASFPVVWIDSKFQPGPATLQVGSETLPLSRDPNDSPPAAGSYLCLE